MKVLGISAFYHDSAAALVVDGEIKAAVQEERFNRVKHYAGFPEQSIRYCLDAAGLTMDDIDLVAFYEKPFLKFERLLENYMAFAPRGFSSFVKAMPVWLAEKLFQKDQLLKLLGGVAGTKRFPVEKLVFTEHHISHAASAFYPSPFDSAAVLTVDGVGEWCSTSVAVGDGTSLNAIQEIHYPHSLGLLYSAITYYTGFKVNSGEYKVMGLAPYGTPKYAQTILDNLIDLKDDGSYRLNMDYFNFATGLTMTNAKFDKLFGGPPRTSESRITQKEMDLAASVQEVIEIAMLKLARNTRKETGQKNLCMAGGVALNCVANGILEREQIFDQIWIQPASGDAGGALGAALYVDHAAQGTPRPALAPGHMDRMKGSYLGPVESQDDITASLTAAGAKFEVLDDAALLPKLAQDLADGKGVGWHNGRMEFGPRALGARSILGDPRSPAMQKMLNLKVKYRESFRPFAPSVKAENVADWFEQETPSPYMLLVAPVLEKHRIAMTEEEQKLEGIDLLNIPRSSVPAITHVDYSARIQTVHQETNPRYWTLLEEFQKLTDCPMLVNTSFNVRGEPIVNTAADAFRCFMGTDIEVLVVGNAYLRKEDQDPSLRQQYFEEFELD